MRHNPEVERLAKEGRVEADGIAIGLIVRTDEIGVATFGSVFALANTNGAPASSPSTFGDGLHFSEARGSALRAPRGETPAQVRAQAHARLVEHVGERLAFVGGLEQLAIRPSRR